MAVITVDFDGTLFRGDSFRIMWRVAQKEFSRKQWAVVAAGLTKAGTLGLAKGKNAFKVQFFRAFAKGFKGKDKQELNRFFTRLFNVGKREVNWEMVQKIRMHQKSGDEVIVLSGALTPFLQIFIQEIGLDVHIISTELLYDENGVCTGVGTVVNGQQKVKSVQTWVQNAIRAGRISGETAKDVWAYADSKSDIPLFEFANYPVVVNPNDTMKEIAGRNNWPVLL